MGTTGLIPGSQYCHVDHPYQRISLHRPLGLSSVDEPWPPVSATLGCTLPQECQRCRCAQEAGSATRESLSVTSSDPDLSKRDTLTAEQIEAFDPGAAEMKVQCGAGTVRRRHTVSIWFHLCHSRVANLKSIKWWSPFQLVVLHFHTWHRACRQLPKANFRLMFKLMFTRATAPQPSPERPWLSDMRSSGTLAAVEGSVACWLSGSASTRHGSLSPQARQALREQLCSGQTERLRMDAAYALGRSGDADTLIAGLTHHHAAVARASSYGLSAIGDDVVQLCPILNELLASNSSAELEPAEAARLAFAIGEGVRSADAACECVAVLVAMVEAAQAGMDAYLRSESFVRQEGKGQRLFRLRSVVLKWS